MPNPTVRFACVAQGTDDRAVVEAVYLFRSLRAFGGELANARAVVYFVERVPLLGAQAMAALQVEVDCVDAVDPRCPTANKIQMLRLRRDEDYLIALDTDAVVLRDISAFLMGDAVQAKPADRDPLSTEQWRRLFAHFHLAFPNFRAATTTTNTECVPYFNSGVLIVPRSYTDELRERWKRYIVDLLAAYQELPDIRDHHFFTDQFAFTLTLSSGSIPFRPLPITMNFPTHFPVHPMHAPESASPFILHHHHRLRREGGLLPCAHGPCPRVDGAIEQFNRMCDLGDIDVPSRARMVERMSLRRFAAGLRRKLARRLFVTAGRWV